MVPVQAGIVMVEVVTPLEKTRDEGRPLAARAGTRDATATTERLLRVESVAREEPITNDETRITNHELRATSRTSTISPTRDARRATRDAGGETRDGGAASDANPLLAEMYRRIARAKFYPAAAQRERLEGRPVVAFRIEPSGKIAESHIAQSSGNVLLDAAALTTVRHAAPLPYLSGLWSVPIHYAARR